MLNLGAARRLLQALPIKDRDSAAVVRFALNSNQARMLSLLEEHQRKGNPLWAIILKARRVGVSSLVDALLTCHCLSTANAHNLIVAHQMRTTEALFSVPRRLVGGLPFSLPPPQTKRIVFPHPEGDSLLDIATAGTVETGRGFTLSGLHICLARGSLVSLADGRAVPVEKVGVGDVVWTHVGSPAKVKAVHRNSRAGRRLYSIQPWMSCYGIVATEDHKLLTARGWVSARELTLNDEVGYPRKRISQTLLRLPLPLTNKTAELTKEFGFLCGYYLAEGSLGRQQGKARRPGWIALSHHPEEIAWPARAATAAEPYCTSTKTGVKKNHIGTSGRTTIYGMHLALFIEQNFGRADGKRFPDWIYEAPREFIEGAVCGYVCGDGSKKITAAQGYKSPTIQVVSCRLRLLMQLRDLLAALGWGWGALYEHHDAFVDSRGWKCKQSWSLGLHGSVGMKFRLILGLESVEDSSCRLRSQKYRLDSGQVWVRLKEISFVDAVAGCDDTVFDLEIDSPDHSFETVAGIVHNSEGALLPASQSFPSLLPAVSFHRDSMLFIESTANGQTGVGETFYNYWQAAVRGDNEFLAMFLSWLDDVACRRPAGEAADAPIDEFEKELLAAGADKEQLAWRRWAVETLCDGDPLRFYQEFPHSASVAFLATGNPAFTADELRIAESGVREPLAYGRVETAADEHRADGLTISNGLVFIPVPRSSLAVWALPRPGCSYYIGADAARGVESGDFAAAVCWCAETGEQVCRFSSKIGAEDFAKVLNYLGRFYNNAMLNPELTGNLGLWTQKVLRDQFNYPNLYRWKGRDDKVSSPAYKRTSLGWETTYRTRELMLVSFREGVRHGRSKVRDRALYSQMASAQRQEGMRWEVKQAHDDILVAAMIGWVALEQNHRFGAGSYSHPTDEAEELAALRRKLPGMLDDLQRQHSKHFLKVLGHARRKKEESRLEGALL